MSVRKRASFLALLVAICMIFSFSACGDGTTVDGSKPAGGNTSSDGAVTEPSKGVDDSDPGNAGDVTEKETKKTGSSAGTTKKGSGSSSGATNLKSVPAYSGKVYITLNGNNPNFTSAEHTTKSFEKYSTLDSLGRCGVAYACIGEDIMPTGERGEIGQVKPTGWHTVKYDIVDGKYLYNRCHLIGWQLTGENANTRNLITGTRYFNVEGMLPFENMVDDYIEETGNHVLYRVTPDFRGSELVARGVQIEAYSVEDDGDGICFNVYIYNIQPGITIDYATGKSSLGGTFAATTTKASTPKVTTTRAVVTTTKAATVATTAGVSNVTYIGNRNSMKFHKPTCGSVDRMNESNKVYFYCSRDDVVADGYDPCGNCDP